MALRIFTIQYDPIGANVSCEWMLSGPAGQLAYLTTFGDGVWPIPPSRLLFSGG